LLVVGLVLIIRRQQWYRSVFALILPDIAACQDMFYAIDPLLHEPEHLDNRIGKVLVMQVDGIDLLPLANDDTAGNAHNGAVGWHVVHDHRPSADTSAAADGYVAEHGCSDPDDNPVLERWVALTFFLSGSTKSHALVERDLLTDDARLPDHDTHPVIDEEPIPYGCPRVDLHTRTETRALRKISRETMASVTPQPVVQAVPPDGMKSGVVEENRHRGGGRRVAISDRLYVLTDAREHYSKDLSQAAGVPVHCERS
jgi:hypothetical protein